MIELVQSRTRVFLATFLGTILASIGSLFGDHHVQFVFVLFSTAIICFVFAMWMLVFAERKRVRIDGLQLITYDSAGSKQVFQLDKTTMKTGWNLGVEIVLKEADQCISIRQIEFGKSRLNQITEYIRAAQCLSEENEPSKRKRRD